MTRSVLRACDILKAFRLDGEQLLLADVTERTGLSQTTSFRLLQTLVQGGLLERCGRGVYQTCFRPKTALSFRLGFAAQTDSCFSREVTESLRSAAARERLHLVMVNNRYSAKEALRNADLLIRERVDLVLEYQTYERVAPMIASKFIEANIPVIAMEIPHPGAHYFGTNNYEAGLIGGKALGRWTTRHWPSAPERILLMELPIAGPLLGLRITGMIDGLRKEIPAIDSLPTTHLDGKGDFEHIFDKVRRFLRRSPLKPTLVCAVNDLCALAVLRAFEECGGANMCAVVGQNGIPEARDELRRPGTRLTGTVAYFPEHYGDELVRMALDILRKKPAPLAVFTKHQLITPENVDLLYPLDRGTGPRSAQ
jgi:ribose transport system substrate-binding protein